MIKRIFNSPVLISGIVANLLVAASTARFFRLPYGSGLDFDDWFLAFVIPISALSFIIGFVLYNHVLLGRDPEQTDAKPTALDNIGLALNLTPFGLALSLLYLAFKIRGLWDNG